MVAIARQHADVEAGLHQHRQAQRRVFAYVATFASLFLGFFVLRRFGWQGSTELHTLMEALAAMLAFIVGTMALVRFHSKKSSTFLFVGTGFLATGLLDGYHAGSIKMGSWRRLTTTPTT